MKLTKNKKIALIFLIIVALGCIIYVLCCTKTTETAPKTPIKVSQDALISPQNFVVWQENKNIPPFFVKKIWDEHKVQSCRECHGSGKTLSQLKGKGIKKAHWHITQAHGKAELMNCASCHHQEKVWQFKADSKSSDSKSHHKVQHKTFEANMSVKTCAQCHFNEKKDWEIGAHGKRVSGWKKQRAVMHCTQCHNPHQPAIPKRWPSIAPNRPLHQ